VLAGAPAPDDAAGPTRREQLAAALLRLVVAGGLRWMRTAW
jgi:hypothetical protein